MADSSTDNEASVHQSDLILICGALILSAFKRSADNQATTKRRTASIKLVTMTEEHAAKPNHSNCQAEGVKDASHAPDAINIRHFWKMVYNPGQADIQLDYLLDRSIPWGRCANVMTFKLPKMIGSERQGDATEFQPMEKQQIITEIVRHMRCHALEAAHATLPCVVFRGTTIEVCCKDHKVADSLWRSPPLFNGLPMTVAAKLFDSDYTAAYRFFELPTHTSKPFEVNLAEYVSSIPDIFDKEHMIVVAQFYAVEESAVEEDDVFTGQACIFVGTTQDATKNIEDMLPAFLEVSPVMLEY